MKDICFLFIVIICFTSCCPKSYTLSDLQNNIIEFSKDDGIINQEEYTRLINGIKSSKDKKTQRFRNNLNEINFPELNDYIIKYAKTKSINLEDRDIWQYNSSGSPQKDFNINTFIENSASMDGYLNDPSTQFRNSIYSLLTKFKSFAKKDSLNLYFINKESQVQFKNASNDEVERFKDILNPNDFRKISLGNRGETDMKDLLSKILNHVDETNLSVFIIDGVFSPGNKYNKKDSDLLHQYLTEQKIGITDVINNKLNSMNSNLSALVLQMKAGFRGIYYFPDDSRVNIQEKIDRPYYIWLFGTDDQIKQIINSKKLEEVDGGYLNKWVLRIPTNRRTKFKIQYNPKIGSFNAKGLPNGIVQKARPSNNNQNKGKFGFHIAVDFSNFLKNDAYFSDPANYKISNPDYYMAIEKIEDINNPTFKGFTHILKLETEKIKDEDLKIELLENIPSWIMESSSIDDSKIQTDESEQSKTFGLQYLMEGVGEAFYPISRDHIISSFQITIKK